MNSITHMFEVNGKKYAIDYINLVFCRLNDDIFEKLKRLCIEHSETAEECPSEIFKELFKQGYFVTNKMEAPIPNLHYDTLNISFAPIHSCNFSCKYCYADGGAATPNFGMKFDKGTIDNMLEYIYLKRYRTYQKYKFDFVSGGEPLLNINILEYFLKSMRNISQLVGKETSVLIVTNGSLITSKILEMLDKYDVYLGISIDGPPKIHNNHRIYSDGSGTYDDVLRGISTLRNAKISSKLKNAWAMCVVARDTDSLVEVMETCFNLGFKRMQMQLLRAASNAPLSIRLSDIPKLKRIYIDLIEHIMQFVRLGDLSRIKMIANDNDSFGKFIRRLLLRYPVYYRCFAGKNKISITAKGDIYPCDSFCNDNAFCMGSIYQEQENKEIRKQFEEAHCQHRKECSACWGRYICGGDCFYNSFVVNDNILKPDPVVCQMNLFFIERTIDMLNNIQSINPEYIKYLAKFLS